MRLSTSKIAFASRFLAQATFPVSEAGRHEFERRSGSLRLRMQAPPSVGLPYGTYPRLLMIWLNTQAVRQQSSYIDLGHTLQQTLDNIGAASSTGRRGTHRRLREQVMRLFSTRLQIKDLDEPNGPPIEVPVTETYRLWAKPKTGARIYHWPRGFVVLGHRMFQEMLHHAVPIRTSTLDALRRSPLTIDLYLWLSYRLFQLQERKIVPWEALEKQFGTNFRCPHDFRRNLIRRLRQVREHYPQAEVQVRRQGLSLSPSSPQVAPQLVQTLPDSDS